MRRDGVFTATPDRLRWRRGPIWYQYTVYCMECDKLKQERGGAGMPECMGCMIGRIPVTRSDRAAECGKKA